MAAVAIVPSGPGVTGPEIGDIQVDVSVTETHTMSATISDEPIETGSDISDHRKRLPRVLSMEGVLSDMRLGAGRNKPLGTVMDRYVQLQTLFDSGQTFNIITGFIFYPSMMCTKFAVSRDKDKGQIVEFSAEFREVEFVAAEVVPIRPNKRDRPKSDATKDEGHKSVTPAPKAVEEKGLIRGAFNAGGVPEASP